MTEHVYDQESEARYARLSDNVTRHLAKADSPEQAIEDFDAAAIRARKLGNTTRAEEFADMAGMIRARQEQADLTLLTALQDIGQGFELT